MSLSLVVGLSLVIYTYTFFSYRFARMTYSQKLHGKVREYLITSTDTRLHDGESSGAAPVFWMFTLPQAPENSVDEVYPNIFMGD